MIALNIIVLAVLLGMLLLMAQLLCYDFLLLCREIRRDLWPWVDCPSKVYADLVLEPSVERSEMESLRSACASAAVPSGPCALKMS
jgi:hypothetical protein